MKEQWFENPNFRNNILILKWPLLNLSWSPVFWGLIHYHKELEELCWEWHLGLSNPWRVCLRLSCHLRICSSEELGIASTWMMQLWCGWLTFSWFLGGAPVNPCVPPSSPYPGKGLPGKSSEMEPTLTGWGRFLGVPGSGAWQRELCSKWFQTIAFLRSAHIPGSFIFRFPPSLSLSEQTTLVLGWLECLGCQLCSLIMSSLISIWVSLLLSWELGLLGGDRWCSAQK